MKIAMDKKRAVLVLGMHRSGTSVIANGVESLGVFIGNNLIPAEKDNAKGFFENRAIIELNNAILGSLGCCWRSINISRDNKLFHGFSDEAKELVRNSYGENHIWGVKDPRLTRLCFFWFDVLEKIGVLPVCILANRHPQNVANSLRKRNGIADVHAFYLWLAYQRDGIEALLQKGGMIIDYDCMMENPQKVMTLIAEYIGLEEAEYSHKIIDFIDVFLDNNLRHNRESGFEKLRYDDNLQTICEKVYRTLHKKALSGSYVRTDNSELVSLIRDVDLFFENRFDYIDGMDLVAYHAFRSERKLICETLVEKEMEIARLRSNVEWVDGRFYNRIYSFFKKKFL